MLKYTLQRVATLIPLLFGLSIGVFLYLHILPGGPVAAMLGDSATPSRVATLNRQFGFDQPVLVEYWHWLTGILHGNLGTSFATGFPISSTIMNRVPASLELTLAAMIVNVVVGWSVGFIAGLRRGSWFDHVTSGLSALGMSVPQFWLATVFVLVFAVKFHFLPSEGYVPFSNSASENLRDLLLPAVALGLSLSPYLIRTTRLATIETAEEQFVRHAKAKGLKRSTIVRYYLARNAILPVVIVLGLQFGALIGGQVVIEELFNWPGIGQLLVTAVNERDYNMVQSLILVLAVLYAVLYLLTELVQAALDPRVRR